MSQSSSLHRREKPSRKSIHGSSVRSGDIPSKTSRRHTKRTAAGAESTALGQEQFIAQNNQKILASLFAKPPSKSNIPRVAASPRMSSLSKKKPTSDIPLSEQKSPSRSPRTTPRSKKKPCSDTLSSKQKSYSRSPPRTKKKPYPDTTSSKQKSPRSKKKTHSDAPLSEQKPSLRSPQKSPRFKKKSCPNTPSSEEKPRSNRSDSLNNYDATVSSNPFFESSMKSYDDEINSLSNDDPIYNVDKTSTRTVATQPLSAISIDLQKKIPRSIMESKRRRTRDPTIVVVEHNSRENATQEKDKKKNERKNKGRRRAWRWVNSFTKSQFLVGYMP